MGTSTGPQTDGGTLTGSGGEPRFPAEIFVRSLRTEQDATAQIGLVSNSHRLRVSEAVSLFRTFLLDGSYQGPW